jgi:hypothetical protein
MIYSPSAGVKKITSQKKANIKISPMAAIYALVDKMKGLPNVA